MTQKIEKNTIKITLVTTDGKSFEGFIFLDVGHRLQDALNDDRVFVPIHVIDQTTLEYKVIQFNKSNISRIEELDQIQKKMLSPELVNHSARN